MDSALMEELAKSTYMAEKENREIRQISESYPDITLDEAYEMQRIRERMMLEDGHKLIGGKMGMTSIAKMKQMGVSEAIYGLLFDYMLINTSDDLVIDECIHPKVESELAFVLKKDLKGPGVTANDVLEATEYISPALEIIDSRYLNFKFKLAEVIIDNCSSKKFKLGADKLGPKDFNLVETAVTLYINDAECVKGKGGDVLGNPALAVAAYANLLAKENRYIHAGDIVLSGAITAATTIHKGDHVRSEFSNMGLVEMHVV